MKNLLHLFVAVATMMLFVPAVSADWEDNFDSYANNSGLHDQGNWEGWNNDPAFDAYVTDVYSSSSPHSVAISPTSDIVQPFSEYSGEWVMTSWHYIPAGSTGDQFWILCNTYPTAYPLDWSLQLMFENSTGNMTVIEGTSVVSIVYDQWVEVKAEINLGTDTQHIYYNGVFLESINWSSGGAIAIGCLDLFSDGGSTIYWDDCSLASAGALEQTTWGQIKTSLH
jgi:hypothetical protein